MTLQPVKSSAVSAVGFDTDTRTITVQVPNGTLYCYAECTQEDFEQLLGAESIGKHFSKHFRPRPFTKIVPEKAAV